ncbi:uncharacterized protein SPPG_02789 [Spizellomyces punctatus DAOM BR117]|uniref:Tetraspanin n=1 Tax=Spizellomyces punctatus (strain DAOM BR117) TaxID=645134 RepID=A0A0L0HNC2_SPIPD|nr:uncharacterized protein SPPG_02789 [Spizellomyces punctatus DAOM BR117]KND02314.1 hypothetical protein SPPG_02789 [Spizellomyces punctatus DAOM BR117]|eukprot:XP_016610353.1 hypothetical protein SPPG_02789 [Spizellomyces punctatus DAOM BR117]
MGKGGAYPDQMFKTAKWATLAVSFLTSLLGAALIGLGVYGLLNPLGSALVPMTLPIVAIAVGTSVFILSILGCFGSAMEHRTIVWVYFGIMLALVILQFVVGIVALTNRGDTINELVDKRWDYLYHNKPRHIRDIEDQYECCGLKYLNDRAWPKYGETCTEKFGYQRSCLGPVKREWDERQKQFGIGVCVLAALQLLGLIPTYYLASRLPSPEERERDLLEEHRRLLHETQNRGGYGTHGQGPWEGARPGGTLQHPVGGPAGAYTYPTNRPGSRGA